MQLVLAPKRTVNIVTVLHGLVTLKETGSVLLSQTCTSKLQTFHHPTQEYTGKPIEAEHLLLGSNCNPPSDPRPSKFRNLPHYQDYVKNLTVNYVNTHHTRMPIQQIIEPANPYALNLDHDYRAITLNQQLIIDINSITNEQSKELEENTRLQSTSKLWHEARKTRLTSSKFGLICKRLSNFEKLAEDLLHPPNLRCAAVQHGRVYETKARDLLQNKLGTAICNSGILIEK